MSDKQDPRISDPSASGGSEACDNTPSQRRHSLPCAEDAAALLAAEDNPLRSISRLHDDELSCMLPFLPLKDLSQLVRCNRRFIALARKERCRELCLEGSSNIALVASSALSHHVTALHLKRRACDALLTRGTLRELRGLSRLTKLQITLWNHFEIGHFMQGLSRENATAALRAVLLTQLCSFSLAVGSRHSQFSGHSAELISCFWTALTDMIQLTELSIEQFSIYLSMRPDLAGLTQLRKLKMGPAGQLGERVAELKQLSQLRELTHYDYCPDRIRLLFQPPHALQLESLTLASDELELDETTMRALLHLPTLTALDSWCVSHDAWPLLPQLPLLRRLRLWPSDWLTPKRMASMCAALSRCSALVDLSFGAEFVSLSPADCAVESKPGQSSVCTKKNEHAPACESRRCARPPARSHTRITDKQWSGGETDEAGTHSKGATSQPVPNAKRKANAKREQRNRAPQSRRKGEADGRKEAQGKRRTRDKYRGRG
jgi:hypothetical protein